MGRSYKKELEELEATFAWALKQEITSLKKAVYSSADLPLLAVASGGAFAAAEFLSQLHLKKFSCVSRAITPLELVSSIPSDRDVSIWLLSASGRNIDIRRSFVHALKQEPRQLTTLCLNPSSPLSREAKKSVWSENLAYIPPSPKDGFLATNSLLAFTMLLGRGYERVGKDFPRSLSNLLKGTGQNLDAINAKCSELWRCPYIVVLHGNTTRMAAFDIESRFTEAALGAVQLADFRNFAHGRHQWLSKHGTETGVLAFYSRGEEALAEQTLAQIPSSIPKVPIEIDGDEITTAVSSLLIAIHIADWAGKVKGIDPGRPGVPDYGRKLYNLRAPSGHVAHKSRETAAVERKLSVIGSRISDAGAEKTLKDSLRAFRKRLRAARFPIIATDYDGTVVDTRFKEAPPSVELQAELNRLLRIGIVLGIATGRGDSVRDALRGFIDSRFWKQVWIGYYNCAQLGRLDDDKYPRKSSVPNGALKGVFDCLSGVKGLHGHAKIKPSRDQLSIIPSGKTSPRKILEIAEQCVLQAGAEDVALVRSGHSVDIVDRKTSKLNILPHLKKEIGQLDAPILAFGDRGRWPGNDHALLGTDFSLSVDEVSPNHDTCWNLAPAGVRGPIALTYYLNRLVSVEDGTSPTVRFKNI